MPKHAFILKRPNAPRSAVVFASPHSARDYPWSFLRRTILDEHLIRSSEDAFVDQLFECAPNYGAPLLLAGVPRAFVDLNRSAEELDPALIEGVRKRAYNPRVASGLGVVPRVVANGRAIYRGKLTYAEAQGRISKYWQPYHHMLQRLLDEAQAGFGQAILIDCHSMPHEAMDSMAKSGRKRPNIVLGDRFGASAGTEVVDLIERAFRAAEFEVARNTPFAGAYVTQAYGRPTRGQHVVQVEIDRSLYMDERLIAPNERFDEFQARLRQVVADIAAIGHGLLPVAAE